MVVRIGCKKDNYREFELGANSNSVIDKLCAILLCLSPILQHYIGFYKNAGFTVLLLVSPILLLRLIEKLQQGKLNLYCTLSIMPLLLYQLYSVFKEDFSVSNFLYRLFMMFIFFTIAAGGVNIKYVIKYAVAICKIASIVIISQSVFYLLFKYHIRVIPVNLLLEGSEMWSDRVFYGVSDGEMYRPSGIFLEPSHFFLYTVPVMSILLLSPKVDKGRFRVVLLLSIASICSTSGMGILVTFALWAVYYLLYKNRRTEKFSLTQLFSMKTILLLAMILGCAVVAYIYVPLVNSAINRILLDESGRSIAIDGRIQQANLLLSKMSWKELIFGASFVSGSIEYNLSGFHSTMYRFGIIGVVLTYYFYGKGLLKLKGGYFYLSFIILIVSFFSAHTHGTFYMLYFVLFLMNGYYTKSTNYSYQGEKNEK